jgi:hypothetical protein
MVLKGSKIEVMYHNELSNRNITYLIVMQQLM